MKPFTIMNQSILINWIVSRFLILIATTFLSAPSLLAAAGHWMTRKTRNRSLRQKLNRGANRRRRLKFGLVFLGGWRACPVIVE